MIKGLPRKWYKTVVEIKRHYYVDVQIIIKYNENLNFIARVKRLYDIL